MAEARHILCPRAALIGLVVLVLGACSAESERVTFGGNYYPTRERVVDRQDRKVFETTVRRVDQGMEGAIAAGKHAGTRYCITNFGTSQVEWLTATDPAMAVPTGGNLVMRGRCVTW